MNLNIKKKKKQLLYKTGKYKNALNSSTNV